MARKVLLGCGIAASVLYVVMDAIGARRFSGYSYTSQAISELSAIGAPSRPFMLSFGWLYDMLLIAFGVGVWQAAGRMLALRIAARALVGIALLGFVWTFYPMHLRGVAPSYSDTMHVIIAGMQTVLIFIAIGFGTTALGNGFRLYSLLTILTLVLCGVLTWLNAPLIAANLPTPFLGVEERINVFAYVVWHGVLAMALLRHQTPAHAAAPVPKAA
jgi:hypothetical protein